MSSPVNQSVLPVISYETASPEQKALFDGIKKAIGRVPNLYAVLGNSPHTLAGRLAAAAELNKGQFSALEQEIINLASSQANGCDYCIAAHTAILKMYKVEEAETVKFRQGTGSNAKHALLAALAIEVTEKRGRVAEESVERFFAAGYNEAALSEFVAIVALNTWNNFTNNLNNTPVDWPAVPALN